MRNAVIAVLCMGGGLVGQTLWAVGQCCAVYQVNPATGAATEVVLSGSLSGSLGGIGHDGANPVVFGSNGPIWRIDPATATATLVGNHGVPACFTSGRNPTTGRFHAVGSGTLAGFPFGEALWEVIVGGASTLLSQPQTPFGITALAVDGSGVTWAALSAASGNLGTIDPLTGGYSPVTTTPFFNYTAITFHPGTGEMYAASPNSSLHLIDPATGATTALGPMGVPAWSGVGGLCFDPQLPAAALALQFASCPAGTGPVLTSVSGLPPVIGNAGFALQVQQAPPNALSYWFLAAAMQPFALEILSGCWIHIELASLQAMTAAGVNPFAIVATDGSGYALLSVPIPPSSLLAGATVAVQVAIASTSAPLGFVLTGGLQATVGY